MDGRRGVFNSEDFSNVMARRIATYFSFRGLREPTGKDALLWAHDELGEAWNVLSQQEPWVRNNPDDKEPWSKEAYGEELGDAMLMTFVAGYLEQADSLFCMLAKIAKKLTESDDAAAACYIGLLSDIIGGCDKEIKRILEGGGCYGRTK
jgi:hypothetical protein